MDVAPLKEDNMSSFVENSTCPHCGNQMNTETNNRPVLHVTHLCDHCGYYMRCVWGIYDEDTSKLGFEALTKE